MGVPPAPSGVARAHRTGPSPNRPPGRRCAAHSGALGACYSVGFAANAAARGIELEELRYEVEGDIDVHSFLGLADGPRPGFKAIRARAWVRSPNATPEQLDELCRYVQETSPVRDNLANPVPVHTELEVVS